jgi:hypothetical protein
MPANHGAIGDSPVGKDCRMKFMFRLCAFAPLLLACSEGTNDGKSSSTDFTIADGTLSGKVGAQDWTLAAAQTDAFLSEGEPEFWVDLYAEAVTACAMPSKLEKHHVILHVPRTPGDYPMSLTLNGTFVLKQEATDNLIATQGRILVEQVSSSKLSAGVTMQFDADNEVSGHFEATICSE